MRVATAGSVDDGKSTFIGRLLYDCDAIMDDQYESVARTSRQSGEEGVNLALITDGLRAERSQKITIDVAYRPFSTARRRFLLADTPGHAQYTRNMFTGMSTADIAILIVDAEKGPSAQTYRHAFLTSLLRVPHVLIAINKMDLVSYQQDDFDALCGQMRSALGGLEFADLSFAPMSALSGENVATDSSMMPWNRGANVLTYLENVETEFRQEPFDFRFPVQFVIRPNRTLRGLAGQAASGTIRVGEEVVAMPGNQAATIASIRTPRGMAKKCSAGEAAVIELADEIDVGRGSLLVRPKNRATSTSSFEATICWMGDNPSKIAKKYRLLQATGNAQCEIAELVHRINPETLHREDSTSLSINEIGKVVVNTSVPIWVDIFARNRVTGSFTLVDADTNEVAAAGMVTKAPATIDDRSPKNLGLVVWLTGLSGSGKSTLAELLAASLRGQGVPTARLDGDLLRAGLNRDLGFKQEDRDENIRRTAEIARVLADQGQVVICSLISPLAAQRQMARDIVGGAFVEVFVSCSLETVMERDTKGLYAKAVKGEILEFTGISAPYESPLNPDLALDTDRLPPMESFREILEFVEVERQRLRFL
ncbi:MAG: adenylyl-sulfate kinase [Chlorobia bacterium]|nr:adenylyl-sulfate kinase [Fimbriimonadaceae bacterium]